MVWTIDIEQGNSVVELPRVGVIIITTFWTPRNTEPWFRILLKILNRLMKYSTLVSIYYGLDFLTPLWFWLLILERGFIISWWWTPLWFLFAIGGGGVRILWPQYIKLLPMVQNIIAAILNPFSDFHCYWRGGSEYYGHDTFNPPCTYFQFSMQREFKTL